MAQLKITATAYVGKGDYKITGFGLSPEQTAKLETLAKQFNVNKSVVVRAMIDATDMPTKRKK